MTLTRHECGVRSAEAKLGGILPAAPLRTLLEPYRGRYRGDHGGRVHELGLRYAAEYGGSELSPVRFLQRLWADQDWVSIDMADRWCILLGVSLDSVYPLQRWGRFS